MERLHELYKVKEDIFAQKPNSEVYTFSNDQVPFAHKIINGLQENGFTEISITNFFYEDNQDSTVIMRITNPELFAKTFAILLNVQEQYPTWSPEFIIDGIVPILAEEWKQPPTSPETGYSV